VPVQGDASDSIFSINDLEDYARFRLAAAGKRRVLILGVGLIGCEFANDLISGGYEVDLVAPCEQVMPTLLHPAAASAVQTGLEGIGARFHLGPVLTRLLRTDQGLEAHLSDGEVLRCDVVVSAIGLRPRVDLAAAAGLEIGRGVVVDRHLKTSHANIYALGDCAEVDGLNLLYVMPLMSCARALAQTLSGTPTAVKYGPMPVTVKTPVCPLVVSPPPKGAEGVWSVEGQGADIKALCHDAGGNLLGYALTGTAVMDKLALNKALPALLA
jgi:rubredoxin-NAD+ reductase